MFNVTINTIIEPSDWIVEYRDGKLEVCDDKDFENCYERSS